ncbi:MAG: prephenate dehydrogenase/arogenate dehydrogenase family protein [Deltaproteobacteria bacterium]|nr:prephenate dehydrogenase/arogenate dehydrogenase family protein [Deltaproteobacteria bacterium]
MKPVVGIIGGMGQMGRWFQRFFQERGCTVLLADLDTPLTSPEVAARSELVLISVPIPRVAEVVREVAPHLRPDACLADLTSVKQSPLAAMLAAFPGEVVGTHPLFGPGEESIAGRTVVLCRGRGERWFTWLHDLFSAAGARVKVTTATEHDRLMAVVQGLAHFMLIALGMVLRDLGVPPRNLEDFATPTFATLKRLTRHLLTQDAQLYACIQLQNPANRVVLRALEGAVADILYFIQRQDADGLVRLISEIKLHLLGNSGNQPDS